MIKYLNELIMSRVKKAKTIKEIADAGVDVLVSGSAIFGSDNYTETIQDFRKLIA